MIIRINDTELPQYPSEFSVTPMDLDNADTTTRTADGTLNRDRIATKRQIEMAWNVLEWEEISGILQLMTGTFFEVYYPDPMDGTYATRSFYVGNRPAGVAISQGDKIVWQGLKVTLIER